MPHDPAVTAVRAVIDAERVACRRCGVLPSVVIGTESASSDDDQPDWITAQGTCACPPAETEKAK
ncbi:hypothetical protein [Streptomyces qinglanensis]|uniref:hypothetical protein n=1 Tax=Streptomyces qinglanensis TaxID=943816 RepID=UPI001160DA3F|nr:hypothetical protein [Streptomyces qinglanensis]